MIAGSETTSQHEVVVSKDLTIKAEGNQVEKTTASAAEDSRGEADANMNAGASSQTAGAENSTQPSTDNSIDNAEVRVGAGRKLHHG